ncbi:hypothetical protein V6N13_016050 [Hibiscus sabdariffa]
MQQESSQNQLDETSRPQDGVNSCGNTGVFDPDNAGCQSVLDPSYRIRDADETKRAIVAASSRPSGSTVSLREHAVWLPPAAGWCKLNVDAGRDHLSGFAACGGVSRGQGGVWLRDQSWMVRRRVFSLNLVNDRLRSGRDEELNGACDAFHGR